MIKVSGFTIVRNAIKLDFPVEASIRSLLPVCDEVVVNVGRSEDETLALVRAIGDPKIRIVETEWDMSRRNTVLGHETLRAMNRPLVDGLRAQVENLGDAVIDPDDGVVVYGHAFLFEQD